MIKNSRALLVGLFIAVLLMSISGVSAVNTVLGTSNFTFTSDRYIYSNNPAYINGHINLTNSNTTVQQRLIKGNVHVEPTARV